MNLDHEYSNRVYAVLKFIEHHLDEKLPLSRLAEQANFSPFHFQRVFKQVVGETPKQYIKRLRLEAASHLIVLHPEFSILQVALEHGFSSLEAFSRAFKNYYGTSPADFRKSDAAEKLQRVQARAQGNPPVGIDSPSFIPAPHRLTAADLDIEVITLPTKYIISIPSSLKSDTTIVDAYQQLKQWAAARNLLKADTEYFGRLRDLPFFTAREKCRFYPSLTVDTRPEVTGTIDFHEIPSRTYATFQVKGWIDAVLPCLRIFADEWLPNSGYQIYHAPMIMVPLDEPADFPLNEITHQIYLSVSPR